MRPSNPSKVLRFLIILYAMLLAQPTAAYNRTTTSLGVPTAWEQMPITYYLGKNGSKDITDGSDIEAIKRSFATWAAVQCASLEFKLAGMLDQPKAAYNLGGPNQNHVYWVEPPEEWPFPSDAVAVTTVHFQPATGALLDTDLRFNGHNVKWSTTETPAAGFEDIQNTATHEIGHMLGLDHADAFQTDATMFADTKDGDIQKRDLAKDDIDGVCAIYPKSPVASISFSLNAKDVALGLAPCTTSKPLLPSLPPSKSKPPSPQLQGCQQLDPPAPFFLSALLVLLWLARKMITDKDSREGGKDGGYSARRGS